MEKIQTDIFCPTSRQAWRRWLIKNHLSKQAVWLSLYKKESGKPSIAWNEAVEEALCFGWIDSKRKPVDEMQFMQFFSRRKPSGTWSKINKEKIQRLTDKGLMSKAGLACIEVAKQNGSWAILDEVEELNIPKDLSAAFKKQPGAKSYFIGLSKSVRKSILQWLVLAKRPDTRQNRINEIATLAAQKMKPKQFR